jgi:MerR family transcriptional regulator, light-induced transcriptional regulator
MDADVEDGRAGLRVSAVARLLGVAPATLRSWHRRYGIGPSLHVDGRHRRYDDADVERLWRMHAELLRGASTADAARVAVAARDGAAVPAGAAPEPPGRIGGRGLPLPGGSALARRLGRATLAMDPDAVRAVLRDALDTLGVVGTWDTVARPVLVSIADRWADTGAGVEAEHLLSECVMRALAEIPGPEGGPGSRPVLLAGVPGEYHSLPLSALAAALAGRGVATRMLGAALPEDALRAAVQRTAPAAAVLWAQAPPPADLLATRPRTGQHCRWFVAGPGWDGVACPPGVVHLTSLQQATDVVAASVTPAGSGAAGVDHRL